MLISIGLDYRTMTVSERERWVISDDRVPDLYGGMARTELEELVVVRTCNRTELYGWTGGRETDPARLAALWAGAIGLSDAPEHRLVVRRDTAAARHLLRVCGGLESQVLGDIHIAGQVRAAYRDAIRYRGAGTHLRRLFDTALRTGKRVRTETELMAGLSSVGSEAARYLMSRLPAGSPVMVLGCGKIGSHAARTLAEAAGRRVILMNRTEATARDLACELGVEWSPYADLEVLLGEVCGVIVATGAPKPILHPGHIPGGEGRRTPLVLVDVALPRNVAPAVGSVPGVVLRDLDDVHPEAGQVEAARRNAVPAAERLVQEELDSFQEWRSTVEASLALRPLRELVLDVTRREVGYTSQEEEVAERVARRVAAKVMARPMIALREAGIGQAEVIGLATTLERLFGPSLAGPTEN